MLEDSESDAVVHFMPAPSAEGEAASLAIELVAARS